jgi:hypothetical protein
MFHYKSNTLSVYFFLLFFKLITAATFATAQGAGLPQPVDPIPTQQLQSLQTIVQRIIIKLAGTHFLAQLNCLANGAYTPNTNSGATIW